MKINHQKSLSFSVVSLFFSLFIINLINGMPSINSIPYVSTLPKIILIFIFLIGFYCLSKNLTKAILVFILTASIVIGLNFFFSDNIVFFKTSVINFLTNCFPITLFCMALNRWDYLYSYFLKASYFASILIFICYITGLLSFNDALYSMGFSYASILFFLVLLDNFLSKKRIISLIFSLPIIGVIILHGSRGALVCIAIYFLISLYRLFFFQKKKLQAAFLVAIILSAVFFRNALINLMLQLSWKFGIYSRTLVTLSSGTFTESSGRNLIYSQILDSFFKDPFKIRGINADYALTGIYSHNFMLELLYEFGIILGLMIIIALFIIIIISLHRKNSSPKTQLLLLSLSVWLPYLTISSTIWVTPYFWLFLGIYLNRRLASNTRLFLLPMRGIDFS